MNFLIDWISDVVYFWITIIIYTFVLFYLLRFLLHYFCLSYKKFFSLLDRKNWWLFWLLLAERRITVAIIIFFIVLSASNSSCMIVVLCFFWCTRLLWCFFLFRLLKILILVSQSFFFYCYRILRFKRIEPNSACSYCFENELGWLVRVEPNILYELELFFSIPMYRWRFTFTALGLIITQINFLNKRRHHYRLSLTDFSTVVTSSLVLTASCDCKLPPTPDDPLYTDHAIWEKGVHEVTPEDQLRAKEKQKLLDQELQRREAEAQKEQEWNDDFSDLVLLVLFGEVLIYAINAYRRSTGGW